MRPRLDETVASVDAATFAEVVDGDPPVGFLRAGEVFGPWRLVEHLADGGFGTVWRAAAVEEVATDRRRVGIGENAAVKFFGATTGRHRDGIAREVGLARRLGGHWTPEFFGADLESIPQWAAYEFVADATLRDLVRSTGPMSAESLEVFAEDLWDALAFFRQHGVAHRDLTPTNVHVHAATAKPRVIDWGNAGERLATLPTDRLPRTPGYAAPEQVEGGPVGPAADLWSWGAVVCFAATGHPPLAPERYHRAIVTGELPLDLSGVPDALLPALDAALRWDPLDRDPDRIADLLPGRRAHLELAEARAREATLDATLADLDRRVRLRDEHITELAAQIREHERERAAISSVVTRLRDAEAARDVAAREVTSLRATVAELERDRDRLQSEADRAARRTTATRGMTFESMRDRLDRARLALRNRRLEHQVERLRRRHRRRSTRWPLAAWAVAAAAVMVLALTRASWESWLVPVPFLLCATVGAPIAARVTARSGSWSDQCRAAAVGLVLGMPFLAPLAFSAGGVPSAPIARWVVEAPFLTPPPPDAAGVGHGARWVDVDDGDCTVALPEHSYWDVLVVPC